jgi:heme-degrading monooxygenase HmoA
MYGTVAKLTIRPGTAEDFERVASGQADAKMEGYIGSSVYRSDADPSVYWLTAVFQSKEDYLRNADSPEQHQRYTELARFFAADPEWHDGEVVYSTAGA